MLPVLIVGAGPVGLTMAAELARYGRPIRIIDRSPHAAENSQRIVVGSLEALRFVRCLPRGCFAEVAPTEDAVSGLARATEAGRLEYRNAEDSAGSVPVSLRGLAAALDALRSADHG